MGKERRTIRYNSIGLFLSEETAASPVSSAIKFFNRVQSAQLQINVTREDVPQIGSEDFLVRKIVSEAQTTLSLDYLLTDGYEEQTLGLNLATSGQDLSAGSIYSGIKEDKNAFLVIGDEAFDLTGYANRSNGYSGTDVIGLGNCFITDYSITAGVGDVAKASVTLAASNTIYSCVDDYSWMTGAPPGGTVIPGVESLLGQLGGLIQFQNEQSMELQDSLVYQNKAYGIPYPSLNLAQGGIEVAGAPIGEKGVSGDLLTQEEAFVELEDESIIELQSNTPGNFIENPGTGIVFTPSLYKSPVQAIAPGGINIRIENLNIGGPIISGYNEGTCTKGQASIQNFTISLPFAREDLKGFGSMHVYGRKMKFPQLGAISFSILSSAFESGNFKNLFCDDREYQIEVDLNNHCDFTCQPSRNNPTFMRFIINNAKLDSYSLSQSVGQITTVDCSFSFGISRRNGFFMSGSCPSSKAYGSLLGQLGGLVQFQNEQNIELQAPYYY